MPDRTKIIMLTGGLIDWNQSSVDLDTFIRVMGPDKPAQALIHGQAIGIKRVRVGGTVSVYPPGTITRLDDQVWVQTGRGHLAIDRIAVAGLDWNAADFFKLQALCAGESFDISHAWSGNNTSKELSHAA